MIKPEMEKAFNKQINAELYSAYLYMSMAAWFESQQLMGCAHWMKIQVQEEMAHALKMYNFLNERGGRAVMGAIEAPPSDWPSPRECFKAVAEHEAKVTGLIDGLVDLAHSLKDHASSSFLQWYVDEQVEEESSCADIMGKLDLMEGAAGGLFMLDQELAARVFTMPVGVTI